MKGCNTKEMTQGDFPRTQFRIYNRKQDAKIPKKLLFTFSKVFFAVKPILSVLASVCIEGTR